MLHGVLKSLRAFMTHNAGLKLLALFLATVSWYGIRKAISFEVTTPDVRLQVTPPEGFAVQYQSDASADVTFRGSQEDIRLLDVKGLVVNVDMQHVAVAGSYEIALTPDHVEGARGVRPFRLHPARLRVELDREEEKKVPIRPRITGRPLSGQVASAVSDPDTVILRGPARKLQAVDQVTTVPIDVDGRIESFTRRTALAQPGETWHVRMAPSETQVQVTITATPARRQWPGQPVRALIAPHGRKQSVTIEPDRVDVEVSGNADILDRLDAPLVYIDCTDLKPNTLYELEIMVAVRDLELEARTQPSNATVTVKEF